MTLSREQFRAQFPRQPEEDIPDPGEPPAETRFEDIPERGPRGGARSETKRANMAWEQTKADRGAYIAKNRPFIEGQQAMADRGVGLPGSPGSWDINDFTTPRGVSEHGEYHVADFPRGGIAAFRGDQVVGRLQPAMGQVHLIEVATEHRRQGVATAMMEHARRLHGPQFRHGSKRSNAGDAWARAVGGPGI